jgi:multimeric flavodoxin WrbA
MDDTSHSGTTKTLLMVYHSMTGGTRQMVEAAARGAASEPTVRVRLLPAPDAQAADLLDADGYVFGTGTPENLAAMAGLMKDFFDRTYYPALDCISGRPYAALICAGSDGHNAARQVERIATGWRLKAIADPLIVCTHAQTPEAILAPKLISPDDLKRCEELGAALAARMSIGVF